MATVGVIAEEGVGGVGVARVGPVGRPRVVVDEVLLSLFRIRYLPVRWQSSNAPPKRSDELTRGQRRDETLSDVVVERRPGGVGLSGQLVVRMERRHGQVTAVLMDERLGLSRLLGGRR